MSALLVLSTLIPFVNNPHWFFRGFDYGKVQFFVSQVVLFMAGCFLLDFTTPVWVMQGMLLSCIIYNGFILIKFTPFYKIYLPSTEARLSGYMSILSANVYQFNRDHHRFLELVKISNPDIVVTMESNGEWEKSLSALEADYPNHCKVALENTYGMHMYSRLKMHHCKVHYFVAEDIPSIEMELETADGYRFTVFVVHPPPPSPTEEETSKERDGELLSVAKKIRKDQKTTLVVGDFNNVAWARSSVLFRKTAKLVDPRVGRGLISTFDARSWILRFPIDQMYHSPNVFVQELKVLDDFGSDHLPLFCQFYIDEQNEVQHELIEHLEGDDMQEVNQMIAEGKAAQSENRGAERTDNGD